MEAQPTLAIPLSGPLSKEKLATEPDRALLKGKNVLITGGACGLGAAMVKQFAGDGAYVTFADILTEAGEKYAKELQGQGLNVEFVQTDVSSWQSQLNAFKTAMKCNGSFAPLDVVIANAGTLAGPFISSKEPPPSLTEDPPEPPTKVIDVNYKGAMFTCKLAERYFSVPEAKDSLKSLMVVASSGAYVESVYCGHYVATKYAVRGMFRCFRQYMATNGIRTNMLCPWAMPTEIAFNSGWIPRPRNEQEAAAAAEWQKKMPPPVTCEISDVVRTAQHCAVDKDINGRSFLIGPSGAEDVCDDVEGKNSADAIMKHLEVIRPTLEANNAALMYAM